MVKVMQQFLIASFFAVAFAMASQSVNANGPSIGLDEPLNSAQMQQEAVAPANKTVEYAQHLLIEAGYLKADVDGVMNLEDKVALKNFQRQAGLEETGEINTKTLKALKKAARKQAQEDE